ncbi:MAG: hypothetical protein ABJA35_11715 [Parafilimonas sp.]
MTKNRHDFTRRTIDILGKRVAFLCSNPNCRKHTIGPNQNPEKATIIGIAAHITAASPEGPRYDVTLTESERLHIDNGIWLCSNCAMLIDKDENRYSVALLNSWKADAENEMLENLFGKTKIYIQKVIPFLEADLIWSDARRMNVGYSNKNPTIIENGQRIMVLNIAERLPIIYWEIKWHFKFTIHNNSNIPAYNIAIENIGEKEFASMTKLNTLNNLPPFKSVDLEADYYHHVEGVHTVADDILKQKIPKELNGLKLRITYYDDERNNHSTIVEIKNNNVLNYKE